MREWGQLWGKEGAAALDYGVLGVIDPRGKRVLREGMTPETKLLVLVGCYYCSLSCLLPQHNAEDAFSRTFL